MIRFNIAKAIGLVVCVTGVTGVLTVKAMAQGGATGSTTSKNYHVSFDRPEAWGLKYFSSTTLLSGLQPPEPAEGHRFGAINVGIELGWLPTLDAGQRQIGFNGRAPQDLNKAPILARPVVRVGLPWKLTFVAAAPPPFPIFGVRTHLLAFGLERPIVTGERWTLSWRGYGQVG